MINKYDISLVFWCSWTEIHIFLKKIKTCKKINNIDQLKVIITQILRSELIAAVLYLVIISVNEKNNHDTC